MCAISSLAEFPSLITRLFEDDELDPQGCYEIWLNINGNWKQIIIDDYFPVYKTPGGKDQVAYARTKDNELWVMLLEKAYANAYGCFVNIIGG
jgi:calpain-15